MILVILVFSPEGVGVLRLWVSSQGLTLSTDPVNVCLPHLVGPELTPNPLSVGVPVWAWRGPQVVWCGAPDAHCPREGRVFGREGVSKSGVWEVLVSVRATVWDGVAAHGEPVPILCPMLPSHGPSPWRSGPLRCTRVPEKCVPPQPESALCRGPWCM